MAGIETMANLFYNTDQFHADFYYFCYCSKRIQLLKYLEYGY